MEETSPVDPEKTVKSKIDVVYSPIKGQVKPLSEIKDDAFASGVLGKGVAIVPEEGKVVAPFDGTIMTLFPTKHAIGMVSDNGCEVLVHIGLDTVQLDGKYFETSIKTGDKVKKGETLITFDKDKIIREGFSLETPVIVTNHSDYLEIIEAQEKNVNIKDELIKVIV